jgi:hypothetical protein
MRRGCVSWERVRIQLVGLALLLALGAPEDTAAQAIERLEVATDPPQVLASAAGGAPVWSAAGGDELALRVAAVLTGGARQDVTSASGTSFTSLSPQLASVSPEGVVTFARVAERSAVAVRIEHAGRSVLVGFDVNP